MDLDTVISRLGPGDRWQIDRFDSEDAPLRWYPLEAWRVTPAIAYWAPERIAWLIQTSPGHTHALLAWPASQQLGPPAEGWLIPSLENYPDRKGRVLGLPVAEFVPPQWTDASGAPLGEELGVNLSGGAEDGLRELLRALTLPREDRPGQGGLPASAELLTLAVGLALAHAKKDHGTEDWLVCDGAALAVQLAASAYVATYAADRGASWIARPE